MSAHPGPPSGRPGTPAAEPTGPPELARLPAELALAVLELWATLDAWHARRAVPAATDAELEAAVAALEQRWQADG
jgi:hypothetical protein